MKLFESSKQGFCTRKSSVFCKKITDIKKPKEKAALILAFLFFTAILYIADIGCVWRFFLKIPCPGCGMTRAFISLFKGDIKTALEYHFMLPGVPVIFAYVIYDGRIFAGRWTNKVILAVIAAGFLLHWIIEIAAL